MAETSISGASMQRRSIRLKGYDYTQPGAYFITICTNDMAANFGKIVDRQSVVLSQWGKIVEKEWLKTAKQRQYLVLDEHIVMLNHFHGIIMLLENGASTGAENSAAFGAVQERSLSSIVRGFKSAVTRSINLSEKIEGRKVWHRGFYEHIIRSEESLNRIREYIYWNPAKWVQDRFYREEFI